MAYETMNEGSLLMLQKWESKANKCVKGCGDPRQWSNREQKGSQFVSERFRLIEIAPKLIAAPPPPPPTRCRYSGQDLKDC